MGQQICPGQDTKFWRPGDIFEVECSGCGREVEFFKDDVSRRCVGCGARVQNPKLNLGCAQWCEHAKQCLGYDPKEAMLSEGADTTLVDRLIEELKARVGGELSPRLGALEKAKELIALRGPQGLDPKVLLAGALLGGLAAEPARGIMQAAGLETEAAAEVEAILEGRSQAPEAALAADAAALAGGETPSDEALSTEAGRQLARQMQARRA